MRRLAPVLLMTITVMAACETGGPSQSALPSQSVETSPSPSATVTGEPTSSPSPEPAVRDFTAESFLQAMKRADLPVGATVVFDRRTDPNGLLGRPGGYVEKASWADTRVECFSEPPDYDCGGDIEVFDDEADLRERWQYLQGFATAPLIGGFYMWKSDFALVRVGFDLTRARANEYEIFLETFFEGDLQRYRGA
jgi:hypothetical protein